MQDDVIIGKVVAPFGVRGEVKTAILTDFPERFDKGRTITLKLPDGKRQEVKIQSSRMQANGVTLKLSGVETRDDAELLRNAEVVIPESEVAELPEDSYYIHDIIGLRVVTDDGRELGEVTEVIEAGANDVYVTSTGILIPAIKDVVVKVDIKEGQIVIHPIPGLLPGE